jgi:hypothetical protein
MPQWRSYSVKQGDGEVWAFRTIESDKGFVTQLKMYMYIVKSG